LEKKYAGEAPAPDEAAFQEVIRYIFEEIQRRGYNSVNGLTDEDLNVEPGQGAWSIGEILKHELDLIRFFTESIEPGATGDIMSPDVGEKGDWNLDAILPFREVLGERFLEVLTRATPESLMATHPDMPPKAWASWPALMRMLRPLIDYATHVGQVNYARRQLGKPVEKI